MDSDFPAANEVQTQEVVKPKPTDCLNVNSSEYDDEYLREKELEDRSFEE